jgi:hypothetical protein
MKIITFLITFLFLSLSNSSLSNKENFIEFLSDSNQYDYKVKSNLIENTVTNKTYTESDDVNLSFEEIVNKKG